MEDWKGGRMEEGKVGWKFVLVHFNQTLPSTTAISSSVKP